MQIEWLGDVDLYWELSVNFWEFGSDNQYSINYAVALSPVLSSQFATAVALSPVLSWQFAIIAEKYSLKWGFGIGIALVNDTEFAGKDIGSHYQFEDRLGPVMEYGDDPK